MLAQAMVASLSEAQQGVAHLNVDEGEVGITDTDVNAERGQYGLGKGRPC